MGKLINLKPMIASLPNAITFARDREGHSPTTEQWRKWYKLARWAKLRSRQLRDEPLCAFCLRDGVATAATVCDHVHPHRGDPERFWNGPFQSLCKHHHDGEKQRIEGKRWASTP